MESKNHAQCSPLADQRAQKHKSWHPPQLTYSWGEPRADCLERRYHMEYMALASHAMAGEQLQMRSLIENESRPGRAELAERASSEAEQQQSEVVGIPFRNNPEQGLRSLRAALGRC